MEINDHNQPSHSAERSRKAISQVVLFLLPASFMTRWNSLFLHTLTHGQGWVGGGGDDDVAFTCTHV